MKLRPTSTQAQTSVNLVFDIETDGIDSSCIHCVVTQDIDTGQVMEYNDQASKNYSVVNAVCDLETADNIISHNGIMFDVPEIKKHFPFWEGKAKHWDTLILSRFFHPNLLDIDLRRKWHMMPARLYGSHSLKPMATDYNVTKMTLVKQLTGRIGHKKCRITADKTLLS